MEKNRHFTLVVIGEKPHEIIKKYDKNLKVEPYIAFKLSDADKYKQIYLETLKNNIENCDNDLNKSVLLDEYNFIEQMDKLDYYLNLTEKYELDEETGNVILTTNPLGKFDWARPGKNLCMPMLDKDENEIFKGRKSEINWPKIHRYNTWTYEVVWDLVMGNKTPEGDMELKLYNNMKNRKDYFAYFKTRENYVVSNTSFWGYAYVDENGWVELEDNMSQFDWVNNFYDRFITPLSDDTLISLFECYRS